jgi:heme-degrading monooxygenase HmoA
MGPAYNEDEGKLNLPSDQIVILALTNAKLIREKRDGFDDRSREIYENLNENPGYLGGRIRVVILGDEVWTMTVWKDKESLAKFVNGRRHLDAMYMTNQAMSYFRSTSIEVLAKDVPHSWDQIENILENIKFKEHKPF